MWYIILIIILIVLLLWYKKGKIEGYRDPLYLNREKLVYDWYPRSNGSIYGMYRPYGDWDLFTGFPFYNNVY